MKWKLNIVWLVMIASGSLFAAGVLAADHIKKVEAYLRSDFKVILDQNEFHLDNSVLVYNDSAYLPVRELGQLLGATIGWHEGSRSILITRAHNQSVGESNVPEVPLPGTPSKTNPDVGLGDRIVTAPQIDHSTIPDHILLGNLIKYNITYLDQEYPVLGNQYKNTLYFRMSDINRMGINLLGLKLSQDKITAENYVSVDQMYGKWDPMPTKMDLVDGPLIIGETNSAKIKALKSVFTQTYMPGMTNQSVMHVYSIKATGETNEYEYFCGYTNGQYLGYVIKLTMASDGSWSYSIIKTINYNNSATDD